MTVWRDGFRSFRFCVSLVGILALAGCGGSDENPNHLPTYDVTAKVTVDGKPLSWGALVMNSTDPKMPESGALIQEGGTAKFSTYEPEGGIPAGEYEASLRVSSGNMKPVPGVEPLKVTITEEMDGGEVPIEFKGTGEMVKSPL